MSDAGSSRSSSKALIGNLNSERQSRSPLVTRRKLDALAERFQGFEQQVEADVKARLHVEESSTEGMKESLSRLQTMLESEMTRRVEAQEELQAFFDAQTATVTTEFLDRYETICSCVDALGDRMTTVEKDFSQSRERYINDMEERSRVIDADLACFKDNFEQEMRVRREAESILETKFNDLEASSSEKLGQDRQIYSDKTRRVFEDFEELKRQCDATRGEFEDASKLDLQTLRKTIADEAQKREQADDDIVNALNFYTKGLQEALRTFSQMKLKAASGKSAASPEQAAMTPPAPAGG
eukprot:TRINITY_DN8518_c0_g1_i1.p1 TRINITY_DN8518_c0_g1~~TRINITY_DN8518_c0_g1_i1.p1  ORF type:complete len:322 (-),score=78.30 TRINITY_DN8518_c0_g1_i1:52-945(-)